ncbi:MAG TPA: hypothetical protein VMF05_06155 [Stellaceae bacterium]|nr:hypothetical protein [Stellaceae bacterium]
MLRAIAVCSVLLLAVAGPALAQTPAHHAATGVMRNHQTASGGLASGEFSTEAAAKAHCPGDTVVWANLSGSKAYHLSGNKYYGKTKHGTYMCRKEADQAGFHAAGHRASKSTEKGAASKSTKRGG